MSVTEIQALIRQVEQSNEIFPAEALRQLVQSGPEAIPLLVDKLRDPNVLHGHYFASVLSAMPRAWTLPTLTQMLYDADPRVTRAAALALYGDDTEATAEITGPALWVRLKDAEGVVESDLMESLATCTAGSIQQEIAQHASGPTTLLALQSSAILVMQGSGWGLILFLGHVKNSNGALLERARLIFGIDLCDEGYLEDTDYVDGLVEQIRKLLEDSRPLVSWIALASLRAVPDRYHARLIPDLKKAAQHRNRRIRDEAIEKLVEITVVGKRASAAAARQALRALVKSGTPGLARRIKRCFPEWDNERVPSSLRKNQ